MNRYAVQITRTLSVLEHSEIEVEAADPADAEAIALQLMAEGTYDDELDYQLGDTVDSSAWEHVPEYDEIIELDNAIFSKGTP